MKIRALDVLMRIFMTMPRQVIAEAIEHHRVRQQPVRGATDSCTHEPNPTSTVDDGDADLDRVRLRHPG